jgi:penicillin amidase
MLRLRRQAVLDAGAGGATWGRRAGVAVHDPRPEAVMSEVWKAGATAGSGPETGSRPARPRPHRWQRLGGALGLLAAFLLLLAVAAGAWLRHRLLGALPVASGKLAVRGLTAPVQIERDAAGIPTLRGGSRRDVAFATGFVHAQDRFFQMDLLRRRAAGELSELLGPATLDADREIRRHLLRRRAGAVLAASAPDVRDLLTAYAAGANAGLGALASPPFEYLVLRAEPRRWQPEDSVLVLLGMFTQLEDIDGRHEAALTMMRDQLPPALYRFLTPPATEWDAPVAGTPPAVPPVPGPEVCDLRRHPRAAAPAGAGRQDPTRLAAGEPPAGPRLAASNSWAVAGRLTATGGALLANELHLDLGVPNIWYRAALIWPAAAPFAPAVRVVGVTLPGTPPVVVGSNGQVAWGLTNAVLDTSDLVLLDLDSRDPDRYRTPHGPLPFVHRRETLKVKGAPDVKLAVDWTIWGPVVGSDRHGRKRAVRAVVDEPGAADFEILRLETAARLEQALDLASRSGVPAVNFLAADRSGRIGWTIAGRVPRRAGFAGETAASWADGARGWRGLLPASEVPRLVDPESGRLWTANNRVLAGAAAEPLGGGGFVLGARARQIRDDLLALPRATVEDMRRIQLDDRALLLERWHDLLLRVLTPAAVAADARRGELRQLAVRWGGRASVGSAGYRLVRSFRVMVGQAALEPLIAPCRKLDSAFDYFDTVPQYEGPLWQLVTARPRHLLDPRYASWDQLLLAAADQVVEVMSRNGRRLAERTWGERNIAAIDHPLSDALPLGGRLLSMPPLPLPGDVDMPRVQEPSFGATLRMVVSPGREEEAIFQMPGGESGNPISPHYRDGYGAWVAGAASPLLPGKPVATLELRPARHGEPHRADP